MGKYDPRKTLNDMAIRHIVSAAERRLTGDIDQPDNPALASLISQAPRAVTFDGTVSLFEGRQESDTPMDDIVTLLQKLDPARPPPAPHKQVVFGVFFIGHLLYSGWWKSSAQNDRLASGEWCGLEKSVANIRHWLNNGFEQWGPSWVLSSSKEKNEYLCGQIGDRDEANSLHVIVAPEAAARLMAKIGLGLAARVRAKGTLFHDTHNMDFMSDKVKRVLSLATGSSNMSYYLVINDYEEDGSVSDDEIDMDTVKPKIYSAYMWNCLIRESQKELIKSGQIPLHEAIFTWEHTNLLDFDCIKFNYDSLIHKKRYLERRLGEKLVLLQHSYAVGGIVGGVDEEPMVSERELSRIIRETNHALTPSDERTVISMKARAKRNLK